MSHFSLARNMTRNNLHCQEEMAYPVILFDRLSKCGEIWKTVRISGHLQSLGTYISEVKYTVYEKNSLKNFTVFPETVEYGLNLPLLREVIKSTFSNLCKNT